jgi:hypothetical protein
MVVKTSLLPSLEYEPAADRFKPIPATIKLTHYRAEARDRTGLARSARERHKREDDGGGRPAVCLEFSGTGLL